jgi:putative peptidoglycan lipid II flippase
VRAFYSVKDTATPVKIAALDFMVNLGLSLLLRHWLGATGLVLASTTAIIVQTLLLQRALAHRLPGLTFKPLWPDLFKILAATLGMAIIVGGAWHEIAGAGLGRRADWIAVFGLIPAGVLFYGSALWALRVEGRAELVQLVARWRAKPSRG